MHLIDLGMRLHILYMYLHNIVVLSYMYVGGCKNINMNLEDDDTTNGLCISNCM